MTSKTHCTIGIDLGGTKIEAILHDGKRIKKTARVPTEDEGGYEHVLANIATAVEAVRTPDVIAVGIGTPGYVNEGILRGCPNNPALEAKPLAADLSKKLGLPVVHENDAKLFGLAEARLGAGKGKQNVVGLIVGTGVGAGIIVDGHILRGALGAAGEIGHAPYLDKDFEFFTSGPALERMYKEAGGEKNYLSKDILKKLFADAPAKQVRERHRDHLARLVATIVNTFNPDVIVFGGGVAKSIDYKKLREAVKQYALPVPFAHVKLTPFAVSDSAGAIGAAMLAREHAVH
jgi:predicted NBD/HSP70 family sugar kinase